MFIRAFTSGPVSTNAFIAACEVTRQAAIIDAPPDSFEEMSAFLRENDFEPKMIFLTHSHWDHIADAKKWKNEYDIPVYIHSLDVLNLEHPGADGLPCWLPIPSMKPDQLLEEAKEIAVGELLFHIIHTPGHSPGSLCLHEPHKQVLFSGDTLFKGSIGNLSFPTSQPLLMWTSLDKLARLPSETRVFPGHGPQTTIQAESSWLSNAKEIFGS